MEESFIPYPDIDDPDFYDKIFWKKEFQKTRFGPDFHFRTTQEVCTAGEFKIQNHQAFVRNLISPETPYNGILLFYGTGVGKTCASIGISEGLVDYVKKNDKKIWILAPRMIVSNFRNELFSELRDKQEQKLRSVPGSFQCAGDRYYISEKDEPDPKTRLRRIRSLYQQHYSFMGLQAFANLVERMEKAGKDVGQEFENSVIIIDEAHNIAGRDKQEGKATTEDEEAEPEPEEQEEEELAEVQEDEDLSDMSLVKGKRKRGPMRKPFLVLKDILRKCSERGNPVKLILLTATPMKDNQMELADLLELLNLNDGRPFDRNTLFPGGVDGAVNKDYLITSAKGYISYVRGNDPVSFPRAILPPSQYLYEPTATLSYDGKPVTYTYPLNDKGVIYRFNLVKCPMSIYQYKAYRAVRELGQDSTDIAGRQVSNFAYPTNEMDAAVSSEEPIEGSKDLYGISGFNSFFSEHSFVDDSGKKLGTKYYTYKNQNYGYFLEDTTENMFNLKTFSHKFWLFLQFVNQSPGIAYAYSEFEKGGALLLALVLEANGYVRYDPELRFDRSGLPILKDESKATLLKYDRPAHFYRCVCGRLYDECLQYQQELKANPEGQDNREEKDRKEHVFKQATYTIMSGKYKVDSVDFVKTPDNIRGEKVKVVLATRVAGIGIDFNWVRQVYIIDPWHNNTRVYQAIGRGIRFCSHAALPEEERTVTVYKMCSALPDFDSDPDLAEIDPGEVGISEEELQTETTDESVYNRIVQKDINGKAIERVMKQIAIDCEQNKYVNYFGDLDTCPEKEQRGTCDYSRICDYAPCEYECLLYKNPIRYIKVRYRKILGGTGEPDEPSYLLSTGGEYVACDKEAVRQILEMLEIDEDPNMDSCVQLWQVLSKKVGKTKKEADYEELQIDIPVGKVDNSTYNIYFSKPQISKARLYIIKLYRKYTAFTMDQIVKLLMTADPLFEKEFIYTAMDQLVGNPPYILPHEVRDKFNRPGYILFRGKYYIFQPKMVDDTRIPMRSRGLPIARKHETLTLRQVSEAELQKVAPLDPAVLSKLVSEYESLLHNKDKVTTIQNIVSLYIKLKSLQLTELSLLAELTVKNLHIAGSLSQFFFEYMYRAGLFIISDAENRTGQTFQNYMDRIKEGDQEVQLYNIINPSQVQMYKDNNWVRVASLEPDMANIEDLLKAVDERWAMKKNVFLNTRFGLKTPPKTHPMKLKIYENVGADTIYAFFAAPSKSHYTLIDPSSIKISDRLSHILKEFKHADRQFKIVDFSSAVVKYTKEGKESTRSQISGIVCTSIQIPKMQSLLERLINICAGDGMEAYFTQDELVKIRARVNRPAGSKKDNCELVEFILGLLDYMQYENRRWSLNQIETLYYLLITK